jgi:hypothetical protein
MTTQQRIKRFGNPVTNQLQFEQQHMVVWNVPADIRAAIPALPARIYCNKVIVVPLEKALRRCMAEVVHKEIKTYDGCFVVRKQRGSNAISTHSFGLAVDMNAAWNPLVRNVTPATRPALRKAKVQWSEKFLDCWRKEGWNCGADWITVLDGMHFQWDNV